MSTTPLPNSCWKQKEKEKASVSVYCTGDSLKSQTSYLPTGVKTSLQGTATESRGSTNMYCGIFSMPNMELEVLLRA